LIAWIVICFAVFLIGVTKSGLGAGLGLIVVPIVTIALSHTERGGAAALGLLLPLLISGDVISIYQYRKLFDFNLIRPLIVPSAAGIVLGSLLLWLIHDQQNQKLVETLIRLEIGLESILLVGLVWYREWRGDAHKLLPEPLRSWICGLYTGISTTIAHAAGPIVAMYLLPLKPDRRAFVGTTALFFAMANTAKLPTYYAAGLFEQAELSFTVRFLPCVVVGAIVGFWLNKRLTDSGFLRFVYWATFAVGWYLLIDATGTLLRE
jgi:uncharacterized protein